MSNRITLRNLFGKSGILSSASWLNFKSSYSLLTTENDPGALRDWLSCSNSILGLLCSLSELLNCGHILLEGGIKS